MQKAKGLLVSHIYFQMLTDEIFGSTDRRNNSHSIFLL